jgi:hypothetical protein
MNNKDVDQIGQELPPTILYKYRPISDQSLEILQTCKIYFADPVKDFSDVFDCRLDFDYSGSLEEWTEFVIAASHRQGMSPDKEDVRAQMEKMLEARDAGNDLWDRMRSDLAESLLIVNPKSAQRIGILSLCETPVDPVMFAHYGDRHRGFCVGLSTKVGLNGFWYSIDGRFVDRVKYPAQLEAPQFLTRQHAGHIRWKYFTKLSQWSYEREWRVLDYRGGSTVHAMPDGAICEVILGAKISDSDRYKIFSLIQKLSPPPHVRQAVIRNNRIELIELPLGFYLSANGTM